MTDTTNIPVVISRDILDYKKYEAVQTYHTDEHRDTRIYTVLLVLYIL